jgi:hypothetical protein
MRRAPWIAFIQTRAQGVQEQAPLLRARCRTPGCDEAIDVGSHAMPIIEPLSRETENELG